MALPDAPLTRNEIYLSNIAGQGATLPEAPITREEMYLAAIAGVSENIPEAPLTREEMYLDYIAKNGGGGSSYPAWQGGSY